MATPPREFLLPASMGGAAAIELLRERLALAPSRERTHDRVLLDSFDGRLRSAGLRAERPAGRAAGSALTLHEPGAPARRADAGGARRLLAAELPPGPLRERLAGVLEERALLPAARVRSVVQPLAVLDGEEKTVVRLELEHPEAVVDGGRRVALAPRVSVRPVLGYEADFERVVRLLGDRLGLDAPERPLFDEAVVAAGGRPEGTSSKPRVDLAPGTRADVAAASVLTRLLEIAEVNVPGTLDDLDPEFLHDLRVSIRRARSVLRELEGVHDPGQRARVRGELRWAQALTGPVRDLDVQLLGWDELVAPLESERAAELEPLRALLARRRERELARLARALRGARFGGALAAWPGLVAAGDGPDAAVAIDLLAGDRIRRVYRRMVRDGGRIGADSPPEALHELRKRGKELRYLLELFGSPFPQRAVKPMVAVLKDLQDVLGRFQDRAVQIETLRAVRDELAAAPGGPAALIALGPALDALVADQRLAREQFAERFAAFASGRRRALVRDAFPKRRP